MKPIITLYLLVSDVSYRLLHTSDEGFVEIAHSGADLHSIPAHRVPGHSPKEGAERIAVAKVAVKALAEEWARGRYDRIVLSAGPKVLGEIRQDLPKALHGHIAAELHKDLVKIPLSDLPSHFKGAVPAV